MPHNAADVYVAHPLTACCPYSGGRVNTFLQYSISRSNRANKDSCSYGARVSGRIVCRDTRTVPVTPCLMGNYVLCDLVVVVTVSSIVTHHRVIVWDPRRGLLRNKTWVSY